MKSNRPFLTGRQKAVLVSSLLVASIYGVNTSPRLLGVSERSEEPTGTCSNSSAGRTSVRLPLSFEEASDPDAGFSFYSRIGGSLFLVSPTEAVLQTPVVIPVVGDVKSNDRYDKLRMKLVGANEVSTCKGVSAIPARVNYLIGADTKQHRRGVERFARVRSEGVYPGIDVEYHGNPTELEFDFIVGPGSDPREIALRFDGADDIAIGPSGDALIKTRWGDFRQSAPVAFQGVGDKRREVAATYRLKDGLTLCFSVGDYDRELPLVIDPVLTFSTYLGGDSADEPHGVAVDSTGCVYVIGNTISANFPTLNAQQPVFDGPAFIEDVFVTKFNPEGNAVIYSTYLGGHGSDLGLAIAVDSFGNAYITGQTTSADFPTTPDALQPSHGGGIDAFVAKLNPVGDELVYSTYLGGSLGNQRGNAIVIDSLGGVYVAGKTSSSDFPTTTGAFQRNLRGFEDAFVTKLDAAGLLGYSTLLGGEANTDEAFGVAVDSAGSAYVVGHTASTEFPTTPGAAQRRFGGGSDFAGDAFVAKLNAAGSALAYSTYLGGRDGDVGRGIAVDSEGRACVTGSTSSRNFPTVNAIQPDNASGCTDLFSNCNDAFVAKLDQSGGDLVFSTYFGGASRATSPFQAGDSGIGVAVDQLDNAYVAGTTSSTDFPTMRPIQPNKGGNGDGFLLKISGSGELIYSTYVGGPGDESAAAVAASASGEAVIVGAATSIGFPTTQGSFQPDFNGSFDSFSNARDAFIVRVDSDTPLISSAMISGKHLLVFGEKFDSAVVLLNGVKQKTKPTGGDPSTELKGKKTGKKIDPGEQVILRVRNRDGMLSPEFPFTRPMQ